MAWILCSFWIHFHHSVSFRRHVLNVRVINVELRDKHMAAPRRTPPSERWCRFTGCSKGYPRDNPIINENMHAEARKSQSWPNHPRARCTVAFLHHANIGSSTAVDPTGTRLLGAANAIDDDDCLIGACKCHEERARTGSPADQHYIYGS